MERTAPSSRVAGSAHTAANWRGWKQRFAIQGKVDNVMSMLDIEDSASIQIMGKIDGGRTARS